MQFINLIIKKISSVKPSTSTTKRVKEADASKTKDINEKLKDEQKAYLVISSDGEGKQLRGDCLGMYQWNPEDKYYIQVSTEEHHNKDKRQRRYLYQADDGGCWYISIIPGHRTGLMENSSKSSSVPTVSKLIKDSSAKIEFGRLPQDDGFVTVNVKLESPAEEKFNKFAGDFVKGSKYYCGRPVYEESEGGMILYCSDEGKWSIGDKIGVASIRSSSAGWSPSEEDSWSFWDDDQQNYAVAKIVCNVVDFY